MKFLKHIVLPFSVVLILGLIVGSFYGSNSSLLKPLSTILGIMCIVAVVNMIYYIDYI